MGKRSREDLDAPTTNSSEEFQDSSAEIAFSNSWSNTIGLDPDPSKFIHFDLEDLGSSSPLEVMRCSLPPHAKQTISFSSFEEYEVHYNKAHVNRCVECAKNFPTPHFLDLHIAENHDPLNAVFRERGEHTYACFVEDCDRKCSTPQKRRMHLIDKHMFPKDYDFFVINDGIDKRISLLRSGRHRRRSSAAQHKAEKEERVRRRTSWLNNTGHGSAAKEMMSISYGDADKEDALPASNAASDTKDEHKLDDVDGLVEAMSSLKFVPTSVRFGRGKGRGGFSRS